MGLFDQIVSALDNPNQQANPGQLDGIVNVVQQLSQSYGSNPAVMQSVLSIVGNHVRSALQEKQAIAGPEQAQAIVNQFSGTQPNPQAVQSLFTPGQQQQVTQETAQQTGLNAQTIQAMLPILVPVILNLLGSGTNNQSPQNLNPVLSSFLDTNRSGSVDVGDVINLANQFLSHRQS
jgi:hypothetical protein